MTETASPRRCVAVIGVASGLLAGLAAFLLPDLAAGVTALQGATPRSVAFDALVVRGCAVAALLAATWLWAVTCAVALPAARGRTSASVPGVPDPVRRLVLLACGLACGVALAGTVSGPAGAAGPAPVPDGRHQPAGLAGLPLPDRATGVAPDAVPAVGLWRWGPSTHTMAAGRQVVVVRPGDTLWDLAARRLPPGAGAAEITACWHRIHEINRRVIGDDPDLIHPDQRLRLPRH